MDSAAALGAPMSANAAKGFITPAKAAKGIIARAVASAVFASAFLTIFAVSASAGERYALVITGASGGEQYAKKYDAWRAAFTTTLREKFHYAPERMIVLGESAGDGVDVATRANVRKAFGDLRARMTK